MVSVSIDSGPIEATDKLRYVPQDKWHELMMARRRFMRVKLSYDCRCLVQFIADAETMYAPLGFANAEDMVRRGYEVEPEEINIAVEWLKLNPTDDALPLDKVITLGKRGRPKKGEEKGCNTTLKRGTADHWLARLERDGLDELATKVRNKELSANAAAERAGYRKKPTPLDLLRRAWMKASPQQRIAFLSEIRREREAA